MPAIVTSDFIGKTFGSLTISEFNEPQSRRKVLAICKCGIRRWYAWQHVKSGHIVSCGCRVRNGANSPTLTHGLSNSSLYGVWKGMNTRCNNANSPAFKHYGGRGIKICKRWRKFENFYADMNPRPPNSTLDRIDNDGNYCPQNCRWSDWIGQANNKRNNRLITLNGVTKTLAQWADCARLDQMALRRYLEQGHPLDAFID